MSQNKKDKETSLDSIEQDSRNAGNNEDQLNLSREVHDLRVTHDKLNKYTFWLAGFTCLLFFATGVLAFFAMMDQKERRELNKAEFVYKIWDDFNATVSEDTAMAHWYFTNDTMPLLSYETLDSKEFYPYRKSMAKILNYYEDINSLHKKGWVDIIIVKDLFGGVLKSIFRKRYIHRFVELMRQYQMIKYHKTEAQVATSFDGFYIWARRFGYDDSIPVEMKKWEKYYCEDLVVGEHCFGCATQ